MTAELDNTMPWTRVEPPLYWPQIGDFVIADRHLPDGTRQHMVRGHVEHGRVVNNAQILGAADCQDAEFSIETSHLSETKGPCNGHQ